MGVATPIKSAESFQSRTLVSLSLTPLFFVFRFFENLIDPMNGQDVRRPPSTTFAFLRCYLQPHRKVLLATLLLAGIAAVSELFVYIYLGQIIDWMSVGQREGFMNQHGEAFVWMFVVVVLVRPAALLSSRALINLALAPGLSNSTRWHNHRYVLRQSMRFFQNDFAGRIAQKVYQTGHALREVALNIIDGVWLLLIYLAGTLIFFFDANTLLLWPVILWSVGYVLVIVYMVPPVRAKSASLSEANSGLIGRVVDSYTNIQSVKLFAHHSLEEDFAGEGLRKHTNAFRVLMRAILQMTITLTVLNTLLIGGTVAVSVYLWLNEAVTVGEIAVANGLVIRLNQMSSWVLRTITSLFENIGTVQNGMQTISQPMEIVDTPGAADLQIDGGQIRFEQVGFSYGSQSPALSANSKKPTAIVTHCSFSINAGEKVGFVGRSGAGKSTLVNLLMRFHDVDEGAIMIDEQNIATLTQDSVRSSIGVVSQDTSLLHRSIRENICYGRAGASDEQIIEAARRAQAYSFIEQLSDRQGRTGLDAFVGERGVTLSGGQRQRIAIARVILKDAPILILDEATSALDSEVEAAIQEQLAQLMEDKTVLAVAHRLSTIAAMDRLIVIDEGTIVEQGSHQQLMGTGGLYARLWERQSGGFLGVS